MKRLLFLVLLLVFLSMGCAHRPSPVSPLPPSDNAVSKPEEIPLKSPEVPVTSGIGSPDLKETPGNGEKAETETETETKTAGSRPALRPAWQGPAGRAVFRAHGGSSSRHCHR